MTHPYEAVMNRMKESLNQDLLKIPELTKRYHVEHSTDNKFSWTVSETLCSSDNYYTNFCFKLYHPYWGGVFQIDVMAYPACCAMFQMNNFVYDQRHMDESNVAFLMDSVVKEFGTYNVLRRVVLNLVEYPRYLDKKNEYDAPIPMYPHDKPEVEIPSIENPKMKYPHIHTWCKSKKKYGEHLMLNHNTGNIIHFAEVVL